MTENTPVVPQPPMALPPSPKMSAGQKWAIKIAIIAGALLVLQLPLLLVRTLTADRQSQYENVQQEIASSWGGEQNIGLLTRAENENISAEITPEIRYRGIYQAVVYTAKVTINAEYKNLPAATAAGIKVSDVKGITDAAVTVNGKSAPLNDKLQFQLPRGDSKCEIVLTLRGSGGLLFAPGAKNSSFAVSGAWDSPGFVGDVLPQNRTIDGENFTAGWNLGKFNNSAENIGVRLHISAGTYQQVERCFTYATFFLIIFFFTLLAAEIITKTNIHVLQYLVAAGAPVLFYLMLLAFAEKIGFTAGYAVSMAIIVSMVTMYAGMFLGKTVPALVIGGVFTAGYLINFVILRMEDFALLTGTIILAVILAVIMMLTGKINRNQNDVKR